MSPSEILPANYKCSAVCLFRLVFDIVGDDVVRGSALFTFIYYVSVHVWAYLQESILFLALHGFAELNSGRQRLGSSPLYLLSHLGSPPASIAV